MNRQMTFDASTVGGITIRAKGIAGVGIEEEGAPVA